MLVFIIIIIIWCRSDMTKDEIVAELNFDAGVLFWSGILLGILSVGILGYAVIRYCLCTLWTHPYA